MLFTWALSLPVQTRILNKTLLSQAEPVSAPVANKGTLVSETTLEPKLDASQQAKSLQGQELKKQTVTGLSLKSQSDQPGSIVERMLKMKGLDQQGRQKRWRLLRLKRRGLVMGAKARKRDWQKRRVRLMFLVFDTNILVKILGLLLYTNPVHEICPDFDGI